MPERMWTRPQKDAIEASGGTVLVSAAAGSGKTAVLVERVIRLLCDEQNPVSADRLLIVTFSRAAAAEMKRRIGLRLSAMIAENPMNGHLQRQYALLGRANISTVHAFCADLIRQNFQHIQISPDFEIMDERELSLFMDECAAECVEQAYAREDGGAFLSLVELLSTARSDRRLIETVHAIYRFGRSHPFFEQWLADKLRMYDPDIPPAQSPWGETLLRHTRETLLYYRESLEEIARLMQEDEALEKAYLPAFQSDLLQIDRVLELVHGGNWDSVVVALASFPFQTLGRIRGNDPLKERAKQARDDCKKAIKKLAERTMNASEAEYREDTLALRPVIAALFELTGAFAARLEEVKGERKKLDYADLEHIALRLLVEHRDGERVPTEEAPRIASRFETIMVDEYQDSNEVQEHIFEGVSQGGQNLFLVGDVKQSIYGFRQAMPELFLRRRDTYPLYDGQRYPATILLDTNFRSRREVTGAVNFLFSRLMSREMGGVDYGEEESLKCGAVYPDSDGMEPEFLLLDVENDDGEDATLLEARTVAERIDRMLRDGFPVAEGEGTRRCEPRDFCILMRSPNRVAQRWIGELRARDIPAVVAGAGGFLHAREVAGVVSLLRALNNPLLDIDLAAAMLSPLFSFDDDALVRVRLCGRGEPLYLAAQRAAAEGDRDCAEFLSLFGRLRQLCSSLPADELLMRIYAMTGALEAVEVMPRGHARRQNLLLLIEYAKRYHNAGYKGIGRFVGLLDRLREKGSDLEPASASGEVGNAVRLLSVHRSKGLEFPIVFLSDTARRFNLTDLNGATLLHPDFGFACVRRDPELLAQYPTLPMGAIRVEGRKTMLSEEMRILYVALTRAREKLIVTAALKHPAKRITSAVCPLRQGKLSHFAVGEKSCYADWLLMALIHHPDGQALRETGGLGDLAVLEDATRWTIAVTEPGAEVEAEQEEKGRTALPDADLLREVERRVAWSYPALSRTRVPAKLAVSDLAKGEKDVSHRFEKRPRFLTGRGLTAAERGSAMHKFMQFADYTRARDALGEEIDRMVREQFLSPAETASLSRRRLAAFFHGGLAGRMFRSDQIMRELRFLAEFGRDRLGEMFPEMDNESRIVLQGVADCVFLEEDGAVIVDYKTDWIEQIEQLRERYETQVSLYREILSGSLPVPVKECVLYSFTLSEWISL